MTPGDITFSAADLGWVTVWVSEAEYLEDTQKDLSDLFGEIYGKPVALSMVDVAPEARDLTEFAIWDDGDPSVGISGGSSSIALRVDDPERVRPLLVKTFSDLHDFPVAVMTLAEVEADVEAENAAYE